MNPGKVARYALQCWRRGRAPGMINMARGYAAIRSEPDIVRYHPLSIIIEPTLRCNLDCLMCDPALRSRTKQQMTIEQFRHVIGQFPFLQKLAIQGVGEPLMNPDFFDMVEFARRQGVFVYFNTNACLLNEKNCEKLIAAGPNEVRVSIDGAQKQTYEHFRRGAVFEKVIENLTRLGRRAPADMLVGVWFLAMKENIRELPQMPALAANAGVKNLYIQNLHSWGREELSKSVVQELGINKGEFADIVSQTEQEAAKHGVRFNKVSDFSGDQTVRGCQWPWFSTYISVEGFVTPCCVQGSNPDVIQFGNIFETPFAEIWNNKKYQAFRRALKSDSPPKICRGCPAYYTRILT